MIDRAVKDYIRVVSSISLPQADKESMEDFLLRQITAPKKDLPKKYVVAASAVAVVAVGVLLAAREKRQDYRM